MGHPMLPLQSLRPTAQLLAGPTAASHSGQMQLCRQARAWQPRRQRGQQQWEAAQMQVQRHAQQQRSRRSLWRMVTMMQVRLLLRSPLACPYCMCSCTGLMCLSAYFLLQLVLGKQSDAAYLLVRGHFVWFHVCGWPASLFRLQVTTTATCMMTRVTCTTRAAMRMKVRVRHCAGAAKCQPRTLA